MCNFRHVVRVPGKLSVLPGGRLHIPGAGQILVHNRRRGDVHLWSRDGIQCQCTLLDHTASTQLHFKYVYITMRVAFITARCYAERGNGDSKSSVRLSVCL